MRTQSTRRGNARVKPVGLCVCVCACVCVGVTGHTYKHPLLPPPARPLVVLVVAVTLAMLGANVGYQRAAALHHAACEFPPPPSQSP